MPALIERAHLGTKSDRGRASSRRDDLLQSGEGTSANEEDVGGIDLQEFLLWMLAATLRRHGSNRSFHDLEQGLLHAFARHVTCD